MKKTDAAYHTMKSFLDGTEGDLTPMFSAIDDLRSRHGMSHLEVNAVLSSFEIETPPIDNERFFLLVLTLVNHPLFVQDPGGIIRSFIDCLRRDGVKLDDNDALRLFTITELYCEDKSLHIRTRTDAYNAFVRWSRGSIPEDETSCIPSRKIIEAALKACAKTREESLRSIYENPIAEMADHESDRVVGLLLDVIYGYDGYFIRRLSDDVKVSLTRSLLCLLDDIYVSKKRDSRLWRKTTELLACVCSERNYSIALSSLVTRYAGGGILEKDDISPIIAMICLRFGGRAIDVVRTFCLHNDQDPSLLMYQMLLVAGQARETLERFELSIQSLTQE